MRRLNIFERQDHRTALDSNRRADVTLAKAEERLLQIRRTAQVADRFRRSDWRRGSDLQVKFLGQRIERLPIRLPDSRRHLIRQFTCFCIHFVFLNDRQDLRAHVVEALCVRGLFIEHLDDVEAVLRFHEVRDRAFRQAEGRVLEFRHGLPFDDPVEIAALRRRRVLGVFLGKIFEIRAGLGFFQDVFGLRLNFGHFSVRFSERLEQNMFDVDAVLNLELVNMLVVILVQFLIADRRALFQLLEIEERVVRRPLLRNLIMGFVFLEILRELGIRGIDRSRQIGWLAQGVFDRHLFILAAELRYDFAIGDGNPIRQQRVEFLFEELLAHKVFKILHRHSRARLHQSGIALPADPRVAVECGRQILFDAVGFFLRSHFQPDAVAFDFQRFLRDQLVENLLCVKALEGRRQLLAAQLAVQHLLDILSRDF